MNVDPVSIIIIVICVILSSYFSATETAFSSLNRIRMKNMADNGNKRAKLVMKLYEDYDKLLSTILVGNNVVNIASTSLATILFVALINETQGPTVSTIVMTIVVLIFGEISPKSLAKEFPEKFAMLSAPFINALMKLLTPLTFVFGLWRRLLALIFHSSEEVSFTEEELLTIVDEAEQEGGIDEQEGELIRSAIEFNEMEAEDILTPRVDVEAIPATATKEEAAAIFAETGYSRIPVYEESIDNIIGVIHQKDFHNQVYHTDTPLESIINPVTFITKSMKIGNLLTLLQKNKTHLAVVADEYGGTVGIVTMEDILEELVGEIWDEHDEVVEDFVQIDENKYRVLGSANQEKMFEMFDLDEEFESSSVGGWIAEQLNEIPEEGDHFEYKNLSVVVDKVENKRVLEVIITVNPVSEEDEEDED